ncbi:ABC transporter substrate-binding protein [Nakamurella silvestris]|nr:ABC transporter substrate-binding protein [Nakamurella silvestris]
MRTKSVLAAVAAAGLLITSACSSDSNTGSSTTPPPTSNTSVESSSSEAPGSETAGTTEAVGSETAGSTDAGETTSGGAGSGKPDSEWFVRADYDRQLAQRTATPEGDAATPWLQSIDAELIDTAKFKKEGKQNLCFSNASTGNPWRATGYVTMQSQIKVLQEKGVIGEYFYSDAADKDDQQITDIQKFVADGKCGALIVSPATTATLTPAVQAACDSGIPVIVFDRGVNTDCATTFIHPIGGYAYGADGAEFLVKNLEPGKRVLALRIGPGIDVLENRWAAADEIFAQSELEVVGQEFTGGDGAKIKQIVAQYLEQGDIDGIWMDAGAGALSAIEAFEDAGKDYPVFVGEDEMTFLRKWQSEDLNGVGLAYSNFQWRTAALAVEKIWAGEQIPKEWVLPQVPVSETSERDALIETYKELPDLFYARFGGDDLPAFPAGYMGG